MKLGACKDNQYGFKDNKPCMFFKLNKIFNWEPEPYQQSEIQDNAMGMPEKLREKILKMDVQVNILVDTSNDEYVEAADPF